MPNQLKAFAAKILQQSIYWSFCTVTLACQPTNHLSSPDASPQVPAPPSSQQTPDLSPSSAPVVQSPRPNPIFRPIFPALKAQTEVPIFLPGDIPGIEPSEPLYAILESATASSYQILLAYTEDCNGGSACRLGGVLGTAAADTPLNGKPVALQNGITGYFVESTCGANCSDATLTWEQTGYRYTVGIKAGNEAELVEIANSAIANGEL